MTTKKELAEKLEEINEEFGENKYRLYGAYGGNRLDENSGHNDPLYTGFISKKELYNRMDSFLQGIRVAKESSQKIELEYIAKDIARQLNHNATLEIIEKHLDHYLRSSGYGEFLDGQFYSARINLAERIHELID